MDGWTNTKGKESTNKHLNVTYIHTSVINTNEQMINTRQRKNNK